MIVMVFGINLVHLTTRLSDDTGSDFGVIVGHRAFLALSIDASKAATLRLHPRSAHIAMLTLLPLTVVASFRGVGTLLVFGLLVAPPAVT